MCLCVQGRRSIIILFMCSGPQKRYYVFMCSGPTGGAFLSDHFVQERS